MVRFQSNTEKLTAWEIVVQGKVCARAIRTVTPAMKAGPTSEAWSLENCLPKQSRCSRTGRRSLRPVV